MADIVYNNEMSTADSESDTELPSSQDIVPETHEDEYNYRENWRSSELKCIGNFDGGHRQNVRYMLNITDWSVLTGEEYTVHINCNQSEPVKYSVKRLFSQVVSCLMHPINSIECSSMIMIVADNYRAAIICFGCAKKYWRVNNKYRELEMFHVHSHTYNHIHCQGCGDHDYIPCEFINLTEFQETLYFIKLKTMSLTVD